MSAKKAAKIFDDVALADEVPGIADTDTSVKNVVQGAAPSTTSPEWNDYVMGLFTEDEKFDGRPKAAGLRRVAEMLRQGIVSSVPTHVFPPTEQSPRATTCWRVEFGDGTIFGDVADCNENNTDDAFVPFAMATSATRAEARALRKALGISTAAAEEMTSKDTAALARKGPPNKKASDGEYVEEIRMTDNQSNFLDRKFEQLKIDGAKFFKQVFDIDVKRKVTKQQASEAIDKLNWYQQNSSQISEEGLGGYNKNWRSGE